MGGNALEYVSKSESVVNAVSQNKAGIGSTMPFVENRPEAIAQRKIQAIARNSPQTRQSDNYSRGIVQRKIDSDKLNLVGEEHKEMEDEVKPEMKTKRELMRSMFEDQYKFPKDRYWEEDVFKFNPDQDQDKEEESESGTTIEGDNLRLREEFRLEFMIPFLDGMEKTIRDCQLSATEAIEIRAKNFKNVLNTFSVFLDLIKEYQFAYERTFEKEKILVEEKVALARKTQKEEMISLFRENLKTLKDFVIRYIGIPSPQNKDETMKVLL